MFVYYFSASEAKTVLFEVPLANLPDAEEKVPDCLLKPRKIDDFPHFEDYGRDVAEIEQKFGEELSDYFLEAYSAVQNTKTGGYPSFTQGSHYPKCKCGKTKEFFFQLSSEDREDSVVQPWYDNWSPHHIMIGDVGNIYFFVCKDCGEKSIESSWDCY